MKTVLVRYRINAPPDQVFLAIADPRKPFLTSNPITHLEIVGEQDWGIGTIYRWTFSLPFGLTFRFNEVVTEWDAPKRFSYRAISGWEMEAESRLIPEKGQTRVDFSLCYHFPGLWGWLIPAWLVRLGIRRSLANLQRHFENRAGKGANSSSVS